MGWFVVNIIIPIFGTISCLFLMKLLPVEEEYKKKAEVIRAVRDGQLGWIVIGISASLLYEAVSVTAPNYWVVGFAIVVLIANTVISAFGVMFPYKESSAPPKEAGLVAKICSYPVLSFTVMSLIALSGIYTAHHFLLVPEGIPQK